MFKNQTKKHTSFKMFKLPKFEHLKSTFQNIHNSNVELSQIQIAQFQTHKYEIQNSKTKVEFTNVRIIRLGFIF